VPQTRARNVGSLDQEPRSQPQHQPIHRLTPPNPLQLPVQLFLRRFRLPFIVFIHVNFLPSLGCMTQARLPERLQKQKRHPQPHCGWLHSKEPSSRARCAHPLHPPQQVASQNRNNRQKWRCKKQTQNRKSIHVHKHPRQSHSALLERQGRKAADAASNKPAISKKSELTFEVAASGESRKHQARIANSGGSLGLLPQESVASLRGLQAWALAPSSLRKVDPGAMRVCRVEAAGKTRAEPEDRVRGQHRRRPAARAG
jgi:hypothetical protein